MVRALEPLPRGRRKGPEHEIAKLTAENDRLAREVVRLHSLVRASQRSLGIPSGKKPSKAGKRRRKPTHRGKKVVALLRKPAEDNSAGEAKAS